ncbi:MAG: tRNA (adenosine(37)-N6)-dimethylallyltransferase MiaA [Acidimicrobiales bacterium]|nr:tRNA (adenosine(37)-N6)-dimethylallyltransferase MiaA [Acidimicrobiales bacterium]
MQQLTAQPIVVVGPTACGKSAFALEVAHQTDGVELLSIDSMQVYRGMDIGTAKPSVEEQGKVRHHLIDLVDPHESFTLVDFQTAHESARRDIQERNGIPLLVGGTGLYVRGVIDGLTPPPRFPEIVEQLENETQTESLHQRLSQIDPVGASRMENSNRRRIIRALEVTLGTGRPFSSFGPGLNNYPEVPYRILGIEIERTELDKRIEQRYQHQMAAGFLDEVRDLAQVELSVTAGQALGYKELLAHVRGDVSLDDALELAIQRTKRFARRQQRWFRRDPRVEWVPIDQLDALINEISLRL